MKVSGKTGKLTDGTGKEVENLVLDPLGDERGVVSIETKAGSFCWRFSRRSWFVIAPSMSSRNKQQSSSPVIMG